MEEEIWRKLRASRCWLGRQAAGQLCWAKVEDLFLDDDKEVARLFEGKVTWWALPRLEKLAESLGVKPISIAQPVVAQEVAVLGEEKEVSRQLGEVWRTCPCS